MMRSKREPSIGKVFTNELAVRVRKNSGPVRVRENTLHGQSCNAQRSLPFSGRIRCECGAMDVFIKAVTRGGLRRTYTARTGNL